MNELVDKELRSRLDGADQILKFDQRLEDSGSPIKADERIRLYRKLLQTLGEGPSIENPSSSIGLCLGHVQSGKTTAMTALCAMAADDGYALVIAVLGSTNLLLAQNSERIKSGLGIGDDLRSDYRWFHLDATELGRGKGRRLEDALSSKRCVLVTVLKNSRRIATLASTMQQVDFAGARVLVVDDEADQASLNTQVQTESESETYRELNRLCEVFDSRLYVQFTATPYAPLLVDPDDSMSPDFVTFLETGVGYTGAREFFIENASMVTRRVPTSETPKSEPRSLAVGLRSAFASFLVGAALLLADSDDQAPVSMLVHPTNRVAVHERVATLMRRCSQSWAADALGATKLSELPSEIVDELNDLVEQSSGSIARPVEQDLIASLSRVMQLLEISVVNGKASHDRVDWSKSPAHVLVGGNKLDRGFTVEGLTVTYMSRSHSPQLDTIVQRARAFGYRREYLPYCRFYSNQDTIDAFASSVLTDEVLRKELVAWTASGKPLGEWPARAGFLMSDGMRPTRKSVAPWTSSTRFSGWHFCNAPSLESERIQMNYQLVAALGLLEAPLRSYERLSHRTLDEVSFSEVHALLTRFDGVGPVSWKKNGLSSFLDRVVQEVGELGIPVLLLESTEPGTARRRRWIPGIGYSNLMQGRDKSRDQDGYQYPGDRELIPGRSQLQIHHLQHPERPNDSLFTVALRIADDFPTTTEVRRQ